MNAHIFLPRLLSAIVLLHLAIFPRLASAEEMVQGQAIKLQDVVKRTYLTNPVLLSGRQSLKSISEQVTQSWAGALPSVSTGYSASYADINNDGSSSSSNEFSGNQDYSNTESAFNFTIDQPIYSGGSTLADVKAAKSLIRQNIYTQHANEQTILLQAITAYVDLFRDRALMDLAKNNRDVIKKQLDATQDRYDVGELTLTDLSQAKARYARASSDYIATQGAVRATEAQFEKVTGLSANNEFVFPGLDVEIPDNLDAALDVGFNDNPSLLGSLESQLVSKDQIRSIWGELMPQVSLQGQALKSYDPQPGDVDERDSFNVTLNATLPLYQSGAVRSRVREAKYNQMSLKYDSDEIRRQVKELIVQSWQAHETARAELDSRNAQVEASLTAREGVYQEADLGARTILDTLDSDQEYLDAQVDLVIAQRSKVVAAYTLLASIGRLDLKHFGLDDNVYDYSRLDSRSLSGHFSTDIQDVE